MNRVLGVDIGNVILSQMNGTPVHGSLKALRTIVQSNLFTTEKGVNIWLVSKCGSRVQALSLQWLLDLDFWNFTGIAESNVRFCKQFWQKGPICKELGITDFIDDRPRVLNCLTTVTNLIAFNPEPQSLHEYTQKTTLNVVKNWEEVMMHIK